MRKSSFKTIFLLALSLIYLLVTSLIIIPKYNNIMIYWNLFFWLVLLLIQIVFTRISTRKNRVNYDTLQVVAIAVILYLLIYYFSGIFFGFVSNPLSLKLTNILRNVLCYGFAIVGEEYTRCNLVKNIKKSKINMIIIILIFSMISLIPSINNTTFLSNIEIFKFISTLLIPVLSKNILFTYICYKVDYKGSVLYRLITELYIYLLPIFPDSGIYIDSMIGLIFPFIILFILSGLYENADSRSRRRVYRGGSKLFYTVSLSITLVLVLLVSGLVKYQLLAVVSNSMVPVFERGSSVFIEKIEQKDVKNIKKGDIIVYKLDNSFILHRVIQIESNNNKLVFTTKGDNNEVKDNKPVEESQVVGKVLYDIPYIGYPSVWLQEAIS